MVQQYNVVDQPRRDGEAHNFKMSKTINRTKSEGNKDDILLPVAVSCIFSLFRFFFFP